nr:hypothetical protein GCM10025732_11160 [Glycomyces mayteni]
MRSFLWPPTGLAVGFGRKEGSPYACMRFTPSAPARGRLLVPRLEPDGTRADSAVPRGGCGVHPSFRRDGFTLEPNMSRDKPGGEFLAQWHGILRAAAQG